MSSLELFAKIPTSSLFKCLFDLSILQGYIQIFRLVSQTFGWSMVFPFCRSLHEDSVTCRLEILALLKLQTLPCLNGCLSWMTMFSNWNLADLFLIQGLQSSLKPSILGLFWNLYFVCTNVPSDCNDGDKRLEMMNGVHKLTMNYIAIG